MPPRVAWLPAATFLSVCILALTAHARQGGDKQNGAAVCQKIEGALLQRTADGFKSVKAGDQVTAKTLIVGFPEAELRSHDGKVEVKLMLYIGENFPVNEAAISFNDNPKASADIHIDRGVIGIKNLSTKGDTHVQIHSGKQSWQLTLQDPDTQVLVARFGRHEPGMNLLQKNPKKAAGDEPLMHLGVLVVKGRAVVNTGTHTYSMNAPPGPALITWDSNGGLEVKRFEALPEEVRKLDPAEQKAFKQICEITSKLAAGDMGKGLDAMYASENMAERRVAVACAGAIDELPRLWNALENTKHVEMREQAIHTLRNWIGRHSGQLAKLQDHLTNVKKYTPVQARNIVQLLRGFDDQDRKEPVIYQLLILGLQAPLLPVRELAHWHLERLAPAGQKIAYDAGADEATRRQAVAQWQTLIPDGQLPPAPKKDDVKKG